MPQNVLVWISQSNGEVDPISWEALAAARQIAGELGGQTVGLVLGHEVSDLAEQAVSYGADSVLVADDPSLTGIRVQPYSAVLTELVRAHEPAALILGASACGLELSAHISAKLDVGLASDCIGLGVEEGSLCASRPVLSGNLVAQVRFGDRLPHIATIRRRAFAPLEADSTRTGEITSVAAVMEEADIPIRIESFESASGDVSLTDARIVVSGGRGVGGPEGFAPVQALAVALGGAMGASRAAVDAGWIPYAHQVGQTGKTVQPDLYIACGISGAIQHLAGMRTSRVIVAINQDSEAPIFQHATYGIVGDLTQYVPALTEELSGRLGR